MDDRRAYGLDVDVNGAQQPESDSGIAFPSNGKKIGRKLRPKHNTNTKESKQLTKMSTVRIKTR